MSTRRTGRGLERPADVELHEMAAEIAQVERAMAAAFVAGDLDIVGDG